MAVSIRMRCRNNFISNQITAEKSDILRMYFFFRRIFAATKRKDGNERFQADRWRECRHTQILSIYGRWFDDNIFPVDLPIFRIHGYCIGRSFGPWARHSSRRDFGHRIIPLSFQTMAFISVAILLGSYQFMAFMSKAKVSETGAILDSGNDLNIEGGIAE